MLGSLWNCFNYGIVMLELLGFIGYGIVVIMKLLSWNCYVGLVMEL